jgi:hypothetical protein
MCTDSLFNSRVCLSPFATGLLRLRSVCLCSLVADCDVAAAVREVGQGVAVVTHLQVKQFISIRLGRLSKDMKILTAAESLY